MSKAAMNLQDSFLNQVRRENSEVRVLLVNGTLLRGIVKGFDNFTLILNNRNGQHLVYKHAIAQIVTQQPRVKPDEVHTGEPQSTEAADELAAAAVAAGSATDETSAPPPPGNKGGGRREGQGQSRDRGNRQRQEQKQKKEGFNTLDLSGVKLGDK